MPQPTPTELATELTPILEGVDAEARTAALPLVDELAADWLREAGDDKDAPDVIALLREEHEAAIANLSASERLDHLKAAVYERRSRRVSVPSFDLAKARVDNGAVRPDDAAKAEKLIEAIEALGPLVAAVENRVTADPIATRLQDAQLDAQYATGSPVMSRRLGRYARDKRTDLKPN